MEDRIKKLEDYVGKLSSRVAELEMAARKDMPNYYNYQN